MGWEGLGDGGGHAWWARERWFIWKLKSDRPFAGSISPVEMLLKSEPVTSAATYMHS